MKIIYVILAIIVLGFLAIYNRLIRLRNNVKRSRSTIDVYLKQRFDLIPNLIECVKAYAKYESETFEKIAALRSIYNEKEDKDFKKAEELNEGIKDIFGIIENYPNLKSSEQFLNLQKSLEKVESQLQASRRIYNMDVTTYNTFKEKVPYNFVSDLFGFKNFELFNTEFRNNIDVKEEMR